MKLRMMMLLVLVSTVLLFACKSADNEIQAIKTEEQEELVLQERNDNAGKEVIPSGEQSEFNIPKNSVHLKPGEYFEWEAGMKSGSLSFTCTDAYLIKNVSDMLQEGGFADIAMVVASQGGREATAVNYPDYICEDGTLIDSVYLLVVEMMVKSNAAEQNTVNDLDESGFRKGLFSSPYLFAFQPEMVDSSYRIDGSGMAPCYYSKTFDYFSLMNQVTETGNRDMDWCLYELTPGETKAYRLGYLVSDRNEGGLNDFPSLCLAYFGGALDYNVFVDLNLCMGVE